MSHRTIKSRLVKVLREQYIKEALNATDTIVVCNMTMNARYTIQKMMRLRDGMQSLKKKKNVLEKERRNL